MPDRICSCRLATAPLHSSSSPPGASSPAIIQQQQQQQQQQQHKHRRGHAHQLNAMSSVIVWLV
jgi:hypothetical protein